jgi:hypothetical protein
MRRRQETIPAELKDRYYFIDYLRLHRFGKQAGIWKKNRNMLVKEHEYNEDANITARKGYKSYIQRCMKSILDTMYSDFTVIKPRNRFAYEIGKRANNRYQDLIESPEDSEEKIKFIIQRYLLSGEYSDLIIPYRDAVAESRFLSFKNNESGIVITLDPIRSFGYLAIRDLEKVREIQTKIIEVASDKDKLLVSMLKTGLEKARLLPDNSNVRMLDDYGRPTERYGIIKSSNIISGGYNGTELTYLIAFDTGREQSSFPNQFIPVRGEIPTGEEATSLMSPTGTLLERIIEYANTNFRETAGVNSESIFRLSRAAIVREFTNNNDLHSATEVRRIEPTSEILSRISSDHSEETCDECDEPQEDCECCSECGSADCQCEIYSYNYNEDFNEVEELDDEVA